MDRTVGLIILVIFSGAGLISILLIVNLLLPGPVRRTREALEASAGRSLLLGGVNFLFAALVMALLLWLTQQSGGGILSGILAVIAALIALGLLLMMVLGLASLAGLIAMRTGETASPFGSYLRGGLLLVLAGLTPYLGWFIFTPLAIWTGLGGAIQTVLRRKEKTA